MTDTTVEGTMHYHRNERDEFVRYLAEQFPKCFFEDPTHRRPLKRNIIDDLEERKALSRDKLLCALDWYEGHFTYRYTFIAGAERVDIDGRPAGKVTPKEQQENRAWVGARKRELREQQRITPPAVPLWAAGRERTETTVNRANATPPRPIFTRRLHRCTRPSSSPAAS